MKLEIGIAVVLWVAVACGGPLPPEGPHVTGEWEADTPIGLIRLDLTESKSGEITGLGVIRGRDVIIEGLTITGRHEGRRAGFDVAFPLEGAEASFDGMLEGSDRLIGEWVFSDPPNLAGDRFELTFLKTSQNE